MIFDCLGCTAPICLLLVSQHASNDQLIRFILSPKNTGKISFTLLRVVASTWYGYQLACIRSYLCCYVACLFLFSNGKLSFYFLFYVLYVLLRLCNLLLQRRVSTYCVRTCTPKAGPKLDALVHVSRRPKLMVVYPLTMP